MKKWVKRKLDEFVKSTNNESLRAKRSNLIAFIFLSSLDCFVAALLAMTRVWTFCEAIKLGLFGNSSRIGRDRNQKEEGI